EVTLGAPLAAGDLDGFAPDHVIVATGARPEVPGIERSDDAPLATDEDILDGSTAAQGEVVVLGAGRRAIATALACADAGAHVTTVDHDATRVAHAAAALMRRAYKTELARRGIEVLPGPVRWIGASSIRLDDRELPVDLVVLALRLISVRHAVQALPDGV